jgi:hypothetical protein
VRRTSNLGGHGVRLETYHGLVADDTRPSDDVGSVSPIPIRAEVTAAAAVASTQRPPGDGGLGSWLNLWTAAGGLAGCAAFVFLVGGTIEAIRLNAAHLPVGQAITAVPKDTLFALAVDALILPTAISALITVALVAWMRSWAERATGPEAMQRRTEGVWLKEIGQAVERGLTQYRDQAATAEGKKLLSDGMEA